MGNPHALGVSVLRGSESGGGARKICPFLETNRLIPGGGPRKPDSNFAFLRPFSQLGNPHALGVSVLRPSESIGGDRKFFPVLESNCLISGG